MKISELVDKLSELRALHGNIEVKLPETVLDSGANEQRWLARIECVDFEADPSAYGGSKEDSPVIVLL